MPHLSPLLAASFSRNIYTLVESGSIQQGVNALTQKYKKVATVNDKELLSAKTGGPAFIKSRTAFGLCLIGKDAYKGHAFIILRGTKFLADWLTNLNVGVSRSANGQSVHDGFNRSFKTILPQLNPFVSGLISNNIHSIHCIGHSLGGALATLVAEYVQKATGRKPYLYTFGAPRVGLSNFADTLSRALWPENIYRVYHRTDIVPCIPFWPFMHAPTKMASQYDYFQPSPGDFPSGEYHGMDKYLKTVANAGWGDLRGKLTNVTNDKNVEHWIVSKNTVSFSITNLNWLDKAINYVLKKTLGSLGSSITIVSGSTFTLMDRLAYILAKGIDFSGSVSSLVLGLMAKIMNMLGMGRVINKAKATHAFIRSIIERLNRKIQMHCKRILDTVLVNGNGA